MSLVMAKRLYSEVSPLVLFIPEPDDHGAEGAAGGFAEWYDRAVAAADVVLFWWPGACDPRLLPAALAAWQGSQRVVHGTPLGTPHSRYLREYADRQEISAATSLPDLVSVALDKIGTGARRDAGEREVPLAVWRSSSFQRWYGAQTAAGNTLLGARQVWTFDTGPGNSFLLYWALQVRMHVRAEDRVKSNEVVISRPDTAMVALYRRGATIDDTVIVLVREYRSPASTADGFVHELPGGSGAEADQRAQAITETMEETGLTIDAARLRARGSRQLAATMSAHHAHLFAAAITDDELGRLQAARSRPFGDGGTEQTWPEIVTFREIRRTHLVDWATLGMIADAVLDDSDTPHGFV
jgi:8-oxo-dGTP pyrophosphatase MutT (NUDIX family)